VKNRNLIGIGLTALLALTTQSCARHTGETSPGSQAKLTTSGELIAINGETAEATDQVSLPPGRHDVVVRYRTYRFDYRCHFSFEATGGQVYEIVDQSNPQPMTLYRLRRQNPLWSERLDRVAPTDCYAGPAM